jgi:hypothetical protein
MKTTQVNPIPKRADMSPMTYTLIMPSLLSLTHQAHAWEKPEAQRYDFSYQLYQEADDRIRIESYYLRGDVDLDADTSFRFQYLRDAISGSSPSGALPGGLQPFLADVKDVRYGIMGALSRQFGDHRVELELSRSSEEDYLSYGLALSDKWELNQKNTSLTYGLNFLNDDVTVYGLADQDKKSYDLFAGVTQLIDKNTYVSMNFTLGFNNGYLNDPYKSIQRTDLLSVDDGMGGFIDIPVVNMYAENRPDERMREVLQFQATHLFENLNGALDGVLRFSNDDFGVFSETLQAEWRQAVGEKFEVTPFVRYYHQSAADFFMNTLDGAVTGTPADYPNGSGPNYTADYRMSSFDALSLGLRTRYQITESMAASFSYEHYEMSGSGGDAAPEEAYIEADIWTVGVNLTF